MYFIMLILVKRLRCSKYCTPFFAAEEFGYWSTVNSVSGQLFGINPRKAKELNLHCFDQYLIYQTTKQGIFNIKKTYGAWAMLCSSEI